MTKDFAVPPVVFPPTGGSSGGANVQQRRFSAIPFQQPPPSSSSQIPFLSFNMGSAAASSATHAGPFGGTIASSSSFGGGGGSPSFEDEEPLLDELGIHPDQIWKKTRSILNPFRINQTVHKDSDLSGPIFLYLALCLFQLLAGKIQFGVILGWIVVSSIFLYVVFNMLAGRNGNLNLHTCTSLVGYCLLPVVVLSAVSLFVPQGAGPVKYVLAGVFVLWSTRACSTLVVSLADGGEEHRGLIAYACFLIYTLFSLLVIF
ncbi:PREDICTED: protein YIPF5 homolog [Camelina sativa]|uniref:Protein YIP n=1 Tax=Camelina sativa TaxID=90675 RepID=A0ABM0ZK14_CAMSA|nr:PREDICTED: protein YIPF5 homolog [Camelina sativa]